MKMKKKPRKAIFIFTNKCGRWPGWFSPKNFKHVFLVMEGRYHWQIINPADNHIDWRDSQLKSQQDFADQLSKLHGATMAVECLVWDEPPRKFYYVPVLLPAACHTLVKLIAGLDMLPSFNPYFFYKQLIKYDGKRNFKVIKVWRKNEK